MVEWQRTSSLPGPLPLLLDGPAATQFFGEPSNLTALPCFC